MCVCVCTGQTPTTGGFVCSPPHVLRQGLLLSPVLTNWLEHLASGTGPLPHPLPALEGQRPGYQAWLFSSFGNCDFISSLHVTFLKWLVIFLSSEMFSLSSNMLSLFKISSQKLSKSGTVSATVLYSRGPSPCLQ